MVIEAQKSDKRRCGEGWLVRRLAENIVASTLRSELVMRRCVTTVDGLEGISKLARRASEGFPIIEGPALACASGSF